jgi:hypothetical protein
VDAREPPSQLNIKGTFREHAGNIKGACREYQGNIKGILREHAGNKMQGT